MTRRGKYWRISAILFGVFVSVSTRALAQEAVLEPAGESTAGNELGIDFNPDAVWPWLLEHGPKLLVVLVGALVLQWLVSVASGRIVRALTQRTSRGTQLERENRARTLSGVFQNAATTVIYLGAILIVLDQFNVPITTLLGGVAVAGLAVAFGAQNLIRDYFYGFMILLENQYGVNDVVKIAGISGLVERITLRLTVLRDIEGIVHFVPHGEVKTVSNMTHGWSRALFDIGVAYKEDPDRVMAELVELGKAIRQEPKYADIILDNPEMLGVESLGDSAVVVRFFIKTMPLQQWNVKREMLRRIKRRFDELGIEIPFPHRTLYVRQDEGDALRFVGNEADKRRPNETT